MRVNLKRLQRLVSDGHYKFGVHALNHGQEDGFAKEHCIGAILNGRILESYPSASRVLLVGRFYLTPRTICPLHIVCDLSDPQEVTIVTAYIPRPPEWTTPWQRSESHRGR